MNQEWQALAFCTSQKLIVDYPYSLNITQYKLTYLHYKYSISGAFSKQWKYLILVPSLAPVSWVPPSHQEITTSTVSSVKLQVSVVSVPFLTSLSVTVTPVCRDIETVSLFEARTQFNDFENELIWVKVWSTAVVTSFTAVEITSEICYQMLWKVYNFTPAIARYAPISECFQTPICTSITYRPSITW